MNTNRKRSIARARRRMAIAIADYGTFTKDELITESISLHETLATAGNFGLVAERGLRHLTIERLALIDAEHQRRIHRQQAA